jgi:hypothetical protein
MPCTDGQTGSGRAQDERAARKQLIDEQVRHAQLLSFVDARPDATIGIVDNRRRETGAKNAWRLSGSDQ